MAKWIWFESQGKSGFGTLEGDTIIVHSGDMFGAAKPIGETLKLRTCRCGRPATPRR